MSAVDHRVKAPCRVLLVVENCSVPSDVRVWQEARALTDEGYKVSVICPRHEGEFAREVLDGVAIYRFPYHPNPGAALGYFVEYSLALLQIAALSIVVMLGRGFDVVHAANPPDILFPLAWFYGLLGKRFVFDQHDLSPETFTAKFGTQHGWLYSLLLLLERLSYRAADIVIVTNQSIASIARERGGVASERLFVVRNGPDDSFMRAAPSEATGLLDPPLIGYVGTIGSQDGLEYVVQAISRVASKRDTDGVRCRVIGDGDALSDVKRLASDLGVADRFEFIGWVKDREQIAALMRDVAVCVELAPANGVNEHHTMVKVMEYMALGKPTVAFDLPETRYSAAGSALYATPNDVEDAASKILILLNDPRLREQLAQRGVARVRGALAWRHQRTQLVAAYKKLASVHGSRKWSGKAQY